MYNCTCICVYANANAITFNIPFDTSKSEHVDIQHKHMDNTNDVQFDDNQFFSSIIMQSMCEKYEWYHRFTHEIF